MHLTQPDLHKRSNAPSISICQIEMITYVDYVEYDGPAYRAGMREGDVILSINGADMEKADHKTLVSFIKGCDTRMRMVVLFEDCVRKVELHMRYIQLQTVLQGKMNELERTCLRERELLEGKWKTHSLPARKKATSNCAADSSCSGAADGAAAAEAQSPDGGLANGEGDTDVPVASPFCRPALSTEDVHQLGRSHFRHLHHNQQQQQQHQQSQHQHQFYKHHQQQHMHLQSLGAVIPPPAQFMLTYQYLDPHCRYVLRPSLLLSSSAGSHHHHHHHNHQQPPQQQQQQHQQYYARNSRKSPEDIPVTNFGSNESTDEIVSDSQRSGVQHDSQRQQQHVLSQQQQHHHHHHHQTAATSATTEMNGKQGQPPSGEQQQANSANSHGRTSKSSGRHCHGHSCNPCLGHRKDKSASSASASTTANGGGADNVSLDAYDLASPCCDPHCVPTRLANTCT